jgi:hypothetical protein
MSLALERLHAAFALRLLLRDSTPIGSTDHIDWSILLSVALQNNVLVRVARRLEELTVPMPEFFAQAARKHADRARYSLSAARRIAAVCERNGIEFLFLKVLQHYPDAGRDLDLLLFTRSLAVDDPIAREVGAVPLPSTYEDRLAGAKIYRLPGSSVLLDIKHGRLGKVGEETEYPATLLKRRRTIVVEGKPFFAPSPEDLLVLTAMHRVYGRSSLRVADVLSAATCVLRDTLDWDYIVGVARKLGLYHGLGCYLGYVEQIHSAFFGVELLPEAVHRLFPLDRWGRVEFRDGAYRVPTVWVGGRLYARKLASQIASGNWMGAGRICLLPLVAGATALRRVPLSPPAARGPESIPEVASHAVS